MKTLIFVSLILISLSFLSSCASNEHVDRAHPYADIQDGFMAQEPRTVRPGNSSVNDFFFKHCDQNFDDSHYSKTSYFCNDR